MSTPTVSTRSDAPSLLSGEVEQPTFTEALQNYVRKVRGGDMGSLPAILALTVLAGVFVVLKPETFPSALNIANLFQQGAVVVTIAMGLVFVLLIGEIDLSAGFASGVCGAILAVTLTSIGWPWYVAVLAAVLTGVVIGLVIGLLVAKIGIPSFVTTLGAFLAFQGVVLLIIGTGGNISLTNPVILAIQNKNIPPAIGWALGGLAVAAYGFATIRTWSSRRRQGLLSAPRAMVITKVVAMALVVLGGVLVLNQERSVNPAITSLRGVPIVVPIIVVLALGLGFLLTRTAFGRHIYAVGGNAEATRRAGIPVARIRVTCFIICSSMAAFAGIFAASRATSVDPNAGGSNVLLYAVGAAVIGGTSLFGGKGRITDALIGGAVIAVIDNGMGLLGYSAGIKFVVTGLVLIAAAAVDALSRRRARTTGRG
ncbi:ABC transporter permease [Paraoerskovia sediminicola]|uniref:Xylose transport system permease protein XylH n=1 Tax=Paraoerskovia sediminicola TaxID=1138587 RepID=A0ABN6XBA3_9CELL|nr:ABC transporter permease [Paraoerskovia sediminicola]BDZ41055.1 ABC transporter permease [Paraoerskovia sediminicola]